MSYNIKSKLNQIMEINLQLTGSIMAGNAKCILSALSTNLVSTYCPPVTKGHF